MYVLDENKASLYKHVSCTLDHLAFIKRSNSCWCAGALTTASLSNDKLLDWFLKSKYESYFSMLVWLTLNWKKRILESQAIQVSLNIWGDVTSSWSPFWSQWLSFLLVILPIKKMTASMWMRMRRNLSSIRNDESSAFLRQRNNIFNTLQSTLGLSPQV